MILSLLDGYLHLTTEHPAAKANEGVPVLVDSTGNFYHPSNEVQGRRVADILIGVALDPKEFYGGYSVENAEMYMAIAKFLSLWPEGPQIPEMKLYRVTWRQEVHFYARNDAEAREIWPDNIELHSLDEDPLAIDPGFVEQISFECVSDDYRDVGFEETEGGRYSFKCPTCEATRLEEVLDEGTTSRTILHLGESTHSTGYDAPIEVHESFVLRYQCERCGYILRNAHGDSIKEVKDLPEHPAISRAS